MSSCMECGGAVGVPDDVMKGEIIPCGACGAELEVTDLDPVCLGLAPAVQEDWGE